MAVFEPFQYLTSSCSAAAINKSSLGDVMSRQLKSLLPYGNSYKDL